MTRKSFANVCTADETDNNYPSEGFYVWALHIIFNDTQSTKEDLICSFKNIGSGDRATNLLIKNAWRQFDSEMRKFIERSPIKIDSWNMLMLTMKMRDFDIRAVS